MGVDNKYLHSEITDKIIGIAYKVHNKMGYGHPEKIYHRCFIKELENACLRFKNEAYHKIKYDNEVVGKYFLDFIVEDKIAVEIKVRREIHETDWIQLLNYLKSTGIKVGLLIIFTKKDILIKRLIN